MKKLYFIILALPFFIPSMTYAALQPVLGNPGYFSFPEFAMGSNNSNPSILVTGLVLTSTTSKIAYLAQMPEACTVDNIQLRMGTVTTAAQLDVRLETVNIDTFLPTGTLYGALSDGDLNASTTVSWTSTNLFASTTIATSSLFAVVIQASSSVGNVSVTLSSLGNINNITVTPISITFASSTWTVYLTGSPMFILHCSDGTYANIAGTMPATNFTSLTTASNNAVADRAGAKFSFPFPVNLTAVKYYTSGNQGSSSLILYDSNNTVIATANSWSGMGRSTANGHHIIYFPSSTIPISANSTYRLVLVASSTVSVGIPVVSFDNAAIKNTVSGGANWSFTQATSSLTWLDSATGTPAMQLYFTAFDDAAQTGGGSSGAGFRSSGGMSWIDILKNRIAMLFQPIKDIVAFFTTKVFAMK